MVDTVIQPLPPAEAIRALKVRGVKLQPSFSWQDVFGEEHANAFTVAKSAGFDILQDIHDGLVKALQSGTTFRDFAKDLTPLLQAKGWWGRQIVTDPLDGYKKVAQLGSTRRLQTIFDTNMRVSYAGGHWANFQRNKKARPYLRYVAILDERTRPAHRARHNLCLPVDDPYWDTWAPPCGWNCRCMLQSLSQREVDQMRGILKFEPPQDTYRNFVNKRTGEIVKVPDGIDPGWGHNPGKANAEAAINSSLAEKAAGAPYQLAAALVDDRVHSEDFERWFNDPQGTMPVMAIPPTVAQAIGTDATVALLSDQTMEKQRRRHPEMTLTEYQQLPAIGAAPTLAFTDGDNTFVLIRSRDGRWLYAAAKTTKTGKAAFVTSFRYASDSDIRRKLGQPGVKILIDRRGE